MTEAAIAQLLFNVIGAIGWVLGIATWLKTRNKEQEETAMWDLHAYLYNAVRGNRSFDPPAGTKEWKLCELLVEKGKLSRSPISGYRLPDTTSSLP